MDDYKGLPDYLIVAARQKRKGGLEQRAAKANDGKEWLEQCEKTYIEAMAVAAHVGRFNLKRYIAVNGEKILGFGDDPLLLLNKYCKSEKGRVVIYSMSPKENHLESKRFENIFLLSGEA